MQTKKPNTAAAATVRPGDIVVLAVFLLLSIAVGAFGLQRGSTGQTAEIIVDGERVATLSLHQPGRYEFMGAQGVSVVEVDANGIRMLTSPCPHQFCVRQGSVQDVGEMVVCVPNTVAIRIVGITREDGVDAVAG